MHSRLQRSLFAERNKVVHFHSKVELGLDAVHLLDYCGLGDGRTLLQPEEKEELLKVLLQDGDEEEEVGGLGLGLEYKGYGEYGDDGDDDHDESEEQNDSGAVAEVQAGSAEATTNNSSGPGMYSLGDAQYTYCSQALRPPPQPLPLQKETTTPGRFTTRLRCPTSPAFWSHTECGFPSASARPSAPGQMYRRTPPEARPRVASTHPSGTRSTAKR